jgi:hypothetical protein
MVECHKRLTGTGISACDKLTMVMCAETIEMGLFGGKASPLQHRNATVVSLPSKMILVIGTAAIALYRQHPASDGLHRNASPFRSDACPLQSNEPLQKLVISAPRDRSAVFLVLLTTA